MSPQQDRRSNTGRAEAYAVLIGRLEKATGPDREIDGRIWSELDGRDVRIAHCEHWGGDGLLAKSRKGPRDECVVGVFDENGKFLTVGQSNPPAQYTGSIEACIPGEDIGSVARQKQKPGQPTVWVAVHEPTRDGGPSICGRGHTEAIARRIAALKAIAAQGE